MTAWELSSAFGLGLVGSLHCVQMCGPLVIAWSLPMADGPTSGQVLAHAGYHAGRLTTYGLLGAIAGTAGTAVGVAGRAAGIANAAALVAGALLVMAGLALGGLTARRQWIPIARPGMGAWVSRVAVRLLREPGFGRKLGLGLALGFLPCGLVYAALLQALATGTPAAGAVSMAAFGAGTVPALLGVGLASGRIVGWLGPGPRLAAFGVTLLGIVLLWRGIVGVMPGQMACH